MTVPHPVPSGHDATVGGAQQQWQIEDPSQAVKIFRNLSLIKAAKRVRPAIIKGSFGFALFYSALFLYMFLVGRSDTLDRGVHLKVRRIRAEDGTKIISSLQVQCTLFTFELKAFSQLILASQSAAFLQILLYFHSSSSLFLVSWMLKLQFLFLYHSYVFLYLSQWDKLLCFIVSYNFYCFKPFFLRISFLGKV